MKQVFLLLLFICISTQDELEEVNCKAGYLSPDCSDSVIPSENPFTQSTFKTIGDLLGIGTIQVTDYCELLPIHWQYVIGTFSGNVNFGDISKGDKISLSVSTFEDEIGSYLALYDDLMRLQWIGIIRTFERKTTVALSQSICTPNSQSLFFIGNVSGVVESIYFLNEQGNTDLTLNVDIQNNSSPYLLGSIQSLKRFNWAYITPKCYISGHECHWNNTFPATFALYNNTLYYAISATLPSQSGSAERNYFFVESIIVRGVTYPYSLQFGSIGDATRSTYGSYITNIQVINEKIYISGIWSSSAILHLYNSLNVSTSPHSVSLNSLSMQFFLASYDTNFAYQSNFNEYAVMFDTYKYSSLSRSLRVDNDGRNYLWLSISYLDNTSHTKLHSTFIQLSEDCKIQKISSIDMESSTSLPPLSDFDFSSNSIIDSYVDNSGDILVIGTYTDELTVSNSSPNVDPVEAIVPSSTTSPLLFKFDISGDPILSTPIIFSDELIYTIRSVREMRLDSQGRIILLGSVHLTNNVNKELGMILKLDTEECDGCNSNGWCYIGSQGVGECKCNLQSSGLNCQNSYFIKFTTYLEWGTAANIVPSSLESDPKLQYYSVSVNADNRQVLVSGYINSKISYSQIISPDPQSLEFLDSKFHNRQCFISSFDSENGNVQWTAFATYSNNVDNESFHSEGDCFLWKIDHDPYTGVIFGIGWANIAGTIYFYDSSHNSVNSSTPTLTINIPTGGSMIFVSITSDGVWNYAEIISIQSSCYYTHNCPVTPNIASFPYDVSGDLAVRVTRKNGGIDIYLTGSFLNINGTYDAFVRRYNLNNAHSRPSFVWDCIGYFPEYDELPNVGNRGGIAIDLFSTDTVIATGFWSSPKLFFSDNYHNLFQLQTLYADFRSRWEVVINDNGQIIWLKPTSSYSQTSVEASVPFAILQTPSNTWIGSYKATLSLTNSTKSKRVISNSDYELKEITAITNNSMNILNLNSNGFDTPNSISLNPVSPDEYQHLDELCIYSLSADYDNNVFSVGQQKISTQYSIAGFTPPIIIFSPEDETEQLISNTTLIFEFDNYDYWDFDNAIGVISFRDKHGNLLMIMNTYFGSCSFNDIVVDIYGNIYVIGHSKGDCYFDSILHPYNSSFLLKFTGCENNCNSHGNCVLGFQGIPGECQCYSGWTGSTCLIPICETDDHGVICNGRGSCFSPNNCTCEKGWSPPDCSECADGFQPPSCSHCLAGYAMPDCRCEIGYVYSSNCSDCELSCHPESISTLSISMSPPGDTFYSSSPIYITATSNESMQSWVWQSLSQDLDLHNCKITSTNFTSELQIPPQSVVGEVSILVSANTEDNRTATSRITFEVIQSTGGYCVVDPIEGFHLSTQFNLICNGWNKIDGEENSDVEYQWSYLNSQGMEVFVTEKSFSSSQFAYLSYIFDTNDDFMYSFDDYHDDGGKTIQLRAKIFTSTSILSYSATAVVKPYFLSPLSSVEIAQILHTATNTLTSIETESNHDSDDPYLSKRVEDESSIISSLNILLCFSSIAGYSEELPTIQEIVDASIGALTIPSVQLNDTYIGSFISIFTYLTANPYTPFSLKEYIADSFVTISSALLYNSTTITSLNTQLVSSQLQSSPQLTLLIAYNELSESLSKYIDAIILSQPPSPSSSTSLSPSISPTRSFTRTSTPSPIPHLSVAFSFSAYPSHSITPTITPSSSPSISYGFIPDSSSTFSKSEIELISHLQSTIRQLIQILKLSFYPTLSCGSDAVIIKSKHINFSIQKGGVSSLQLALASPLVTTDLYSHSSTYILAQFVYDQIFTKYKNCVLFEIGVYSSFLFDDNLSRFDPSFLYSFTEFCDLAANQLLLLHSTTYQPLSLLSEYGEVQLYVKFPVKNYCLLPISENTHPSSLISTLYCRVWDSSLRIWIINNQSAVIEDDQLIDCNFMDLNYSIFTITFDERTLVDNFGPSRSPSNTPYPSLFPKSWLSVLYGSSSSETGEASKDTSSSYVLSSETSGDVDVNLSPSYSSFLAITVVILIICSSGLLLLSFVIAVTNKDRLIPFMQRAFSNHDTSLTPIVIEMTELSANDD